MITAQSLKLKKGFTLIELLVVIGILAVLLAITLIAINPAKQFAQANNTKRRSDVNAILNAINQYMADNKGVLPTGITGTCSSATPCVITNDTGVTNRWDLCATLVTEYLAALPVDPQTNNGTPIETCTATYDTAYEIYQAGSGDNRITVTAPDAELTEVITVTR